MAMNICETNFQILLSGTFPYSYGEHNVLKKHLLIHTEEKSYQCPQCGKTFATESYLNSHMTRHTGVRPHSCELCGT